MAHHICVVRRLIAGLALAGLSGCVGAPAAGPYSGAYPQQGVPGPQQVAYGYTCSAGIYTCTLPQQIPLGAACSCPAIGAPSYGTVR